MSETVQEPEALVERYAQLVATIAAQNGASGNVEAEAKSGIERRLADVPSEAHRTAALHRAAIRELAACLVASPAAKPTADAAAVEKLDAAIATLSPDRERAVRGHLSGLETSDLHHMFDWSYQQAWNLVARGMADLRARLKGSNLPSADRELRTLYAARSPQVRHLDEEAWERLSCGELRDMERREALDHVARCRSCVRIYRALVDLEERAAAFDLEYPAHLAPKEIELAGRKTRWLLGLAAVGAAVVMLIAALFALRFIGLIQFGQGPLYDLSQARVVALDPLGPITSPPKEFRWEPLPEAAVYRVKLFSEGGVLIWTSQGSRETSLPWPISVELGTGRYFWQIEAFAADDLTKVIADSPPVTIVVPPFVSGTRASG